MESRFNPPTRPSKIDSIFELQTSHVWKTGQSSLRDRKEKLRSLLKAVLAHQPDICVALTEDFNRSHEESKLIEIYPLVNEMRYAISHLGQWMRSEPVGSPIMLIGTRSRVVYRSKGVVLIISPWNFPLLLTLGPLIYAIAAGNAVILKPSEWTPAISRVMLRIIEDVFEPREVALVQGREEVSRHLLSKPFNHIFFTGSPKVGKKVMAAASEHLASVTLELGGKSPVIIAPDASLKKAAERIAWGKWLNAGQICVAPDYLLVHRSQADSLTKMLNNEWDRFSQGGDMEPTHIINDHHAERLKGYVDEQYAGRQVRMMHPTILVDPQDDHDAHEEEIFGPVLLVYTYDTLEEAIETVRNKPRPLAIYLFTKSRRTVNMVLEKTRSGALCVNHTNVYYFNPALPFGGSNNSGIGRSHGRYGFETFSEKTAEFRQVWSWSAASLIYPPYNTWKRRLIDFLIYWI